MKNYELPKKYYFSSVSSSKGTQLKYYKDGYFYKINKLGNEGFTEYLVSKLLHCTTIPETMIVDYEYCKINGLLGCRSKNFLKKDETFISMNSLFQRLTGYNDLMDILYRYETAAERAHYIDALVQTVGVSNYGAYLNLLVQIDLLIENVDRHANNYGLIFNEAKGAYRLPPIFDSGQSLGIYGTGIQAVSKTLSGSFQDQVVAFGYPIKPLFKIDKAKLNHTLAGIKKVYGETKEIKKLYNLLEQYGSIFYG